MMCSSSAWVTPSGSQKIACRYGHVGARPAELEVLREAEPLQPDEVPVRQVPRRHRQRDQPVAPLGEVGEERRVLLGEVHQVPEAEVPVERDDVSRILRGRVRCDILWGVRAHGRFLLSSS
jgi:hypothetical protein